MAIFKKKEKNRDREQGARSPTNSAPLQHTTQSMAAAARNVSDSYVPQAAAAANSAPNALRSRKTSSVSQTPQPPVVQYGPPGGVRQQAGPGRQSPAPQQYSTMGMNLPTQLQSAGPPQQQQQQQQQSHQTQQSQQQGMLPNGIMSPPPMAPPGAQPANIAAPPLNPGYPWSTRGLRLFQPQTNPPSASISPFPRYGFSVPPYPSHSGHILLFGGLVRDRAHNDLWSLDVRDCSLQLVKTRGDAPLPRIGHVSAIADRIMLVFGGDTKINEDDRQDDGLYVLDLRTQEWTQVPVLAGPTGRYGHAACMQGGYFYVHGGHVDGRNLDDLWSFDIRQLGHGNGPYKWERVPYANPAPLARTGHTLVPYKNKLFLFGGTDGDYHYNDSWSFDLTTGMWAELECIGYIPIPREGHAAAIVDDVIYVFGGRDVHGKDLGDLAAFRISNQRWYMFQNMGPAPMAKSGHSLCAAHGKVFVIGGESNQAPTIQRDDPNMVHVLDTTKIKYPTDQSAPRRNRTTSETTDNRPPVAAAPQGPYGQQSGPGGNLQQPYGSRSVDNLDRSISPPHMVPESRSLVITNDTTGNLQGRHFAKAESVDATAAPGGVGAGAAAAAAAGAGAIAAAAGVNRLTNGAAPQRPKRDDDDEYRRAMSPSVNTNSTDASTPPADRIVTPNDHSQASPRSAGPHAGQPGSPTMPHGQTMHPNAARHSRSPPPQLGDNLERPALPPDAFYFSGKSPTSSSRPGSINGRPGSLLGRPGSIVGRPGSIVGRPGSIAGTADLVRELKARETEAENAKRRELALRVVLSRAIQQGFVVEDDEHTIEAPPADLLGDNEAVREIAEALVRLKQEKAALQNDVAVQMKVANDKIHDAERLQKSTLQEAAYFRARAMALENGSGVDLKRIEAERIADLEHQLESQTTAFEQNRQELEHARAELARNADMSTSASNLEAETLRRAEEAEEENARLAEELEELRDRNATGDRSIREHTERFITLTSVHQQREAERDEYKTQLDAALNKHTEFMTIIEQSQASITSAGLRATELETLHSNAKEQIAQLESELIDARRQLEDKTREAEQAAARAVEAETLHHTTRDEANNLRSLTSGNLGELLVFHRGAKESDERAVKGHQEQLRALEEEKSSLMKLLREAGQRVDATEAAATSHRQKARELATAHQTLRADLRAQRTKLQSAQTEMSKYRDLYASKDAELRDRDQAVTELQTRVSLLRKMLGDHGVVVTDNELDNAELPSTSELESALREKTRAHENVQRELEELTARCRVAEDKAESLNRHVERINNRSGSSASMRSPSPGGTSASEARVLEAERKVQELEEKLSVVESDYQTAVRYVKGTEKMLNRMKNELTKQKTSNIQLSTELDALRGRSSSVEPGRLRDGRSTPSEGELSRRLQTMQSQYASLQAEVAASHDVLSARNREVEVLRTRVEEMERDTDILREDLSQAQNRIATLLQMNQSGIHLGSDDEDERVALRRGSSSSSDGATDMDFAKFTKELKQWERARSPDADDSDKEHSDLLIRGPAGGANGASATHGNDGFVNGGSAGAAAKQFLPPGRKVQVSDAAAPTAVSAAAAVAAAANHSRSSSAYSTDWNPPVQQAQQ